MAYTSLTAASLGGDIILTSTTMQALNDNPIAIAQRLTNAPVVQVPVLDVKTSGTAATWTWPTGVTAVKVTGVGGGAAGGAGAAADGGGGGGGGGGTFIVRIAKVDGLNTITYTVGGAAAASTVVYNSITYTASAGTAGAGGAGGVGGAGGAGGAATNGDINISGGTGGAGSSGASATGYGVGGMGGGTLYGNGGGGGPSGAVGVAGSVYGSGGGGGGGANWGGGAGAAGIVIFEY